MNGAGIFKVRFSVFQMNLLRIKDLFDLPATILRLFFRVKAPLQLHCSGAFLNLIKSE